MVALVRSARFKMLIRAEHSPLWPADSLRLLLLLLDVLTHLPSLDAAPPERSPARTTAFGCSMSLVKVGLVLGDDRAMTEAR